MAIACDDLIALWRISAYYQFLADPTGSAVAQSELKAIEYTLKGQRAQVAKRDLEAVLHYRSALQFHGNATTEKLTKAGLLELQKSSPEAYEQAVFMMAPPPSRQEMGFHDPFMRQEMERERDSPTDQQPWKKY